MPRPQQVVLQARKMPVQARSTASVEAMLDATVQVLLAVGKDRLTTTRVAARAGVSVGTLYQYFPNKSSLLQATLARHLEEVACSVKRVHGKHQGAPLQVLASALITTFLESKLRDLKTSIALYSVSSDVDGWRIAREKSREIHQAIVALLLSSSERLGRDPVVVATMLQGMMAGVSRRLLEADDPVNEQSPIRAELVFLACSYLEACREQR